MSDSAADMIPQMLPGRGGDEAGGHGGDLGIARRRFPTAREPFIDLSTGINPHPYPVPRFSAESLKRLPQGDALAALQEAAARAYGAPSPACVVPAPGTQILLPLAAALVNGGSAAVPAAGYSEYAVAAALAGHRVRLWRDIAECSDAELVMLGNPNNPDGRLFAKRDLLALADGLRRRGGVLVVDEAFMDVGPPGWGLAAEVARGNIVVLRSFGKFFGLAGLRLGFALAAPPLAARIAAALGPWAVSGPAMAVGAKALNDADWTARTRRRLNRGAATLDAMLIGAGLHIIGGTDLFRLAQTAEASALLASAIFEHLGRAGILARAFPQNPRWLRFGLPASRQDWQRLHGALSSLCGDAGAAACAPRQRRMSSRSP